MVQEFYEALQSVLDSSEYERFCKNHPDYYLAHGFIQLDKDGHATAPWQIGFYSKKKDNLCVFTTQPVTQQGFEEAFKDGGVISELGFEKDSFISSQKAIETVASEVAKNHPNEQPLNHIVILQIIDKIPVYNITVVTASFAMITFRIDALTGAVLKEEKKSIMDLRKDEPEKH